MKKLLTTLTFICTITAVRAQNSQNSYIKISYDVNGNRVLREYVGGRPAPPADTANVVLADSAVIPGDTTTNSNLAASIKPNFKVYPNPSDNNFNIALDAAMLQQHCEVLLTDQLGKEHMRKVLTQTVTTISTQQLADGVYYIIVNNGNNRSTVRIVKMSN